MNITLKSLIIENFKGCEKLALDLDGRSATLYGENAVGKTTIYDALTWLLFGKDSRGQTAFEVKPLGLDGLVKDHGAITSVEGVLAVDGASVTLEKRYFEKWTTRRGWSEAQYGGNTSEYFLEGAPVTKTAFTAAVADIIPEERFRTLTSTTWFCEGLDWKKRREMLFDICNAPSEDVLLGQEERFAPLAVGKGSLTLEAYKAKLSRERKGLSDARDSTPTRLDELKKTVSQLADIDFEKIGRDRAAVHEIMEKLRSELLAMSHGGLIDQKRNQLAEIRNQMTALRNDNDSHRISQTAPVADDPRPKLERERRDVQRSIQATCDALAGDQSYADELDEKIQLCRDNWASIDSEVFSESVCRTCGQTLPHSMLEDARAEFKMHQDTRKDDQIKNADSLKQMLAVVGDRCERYGTEITSLQAKLDEIDAQIAAYVPQAVPVIEDMPQYHQQMEALTQQEAGLMIQVEAIKKDSGTIRREIEGRIHQLEDDVIHLDGLLAKRAVLDYTRERMALLNAEAKENARKLDALDKLLFLMDDFTRFKTQYIEESINEKFQLVKFKLFGEQVNGGVAECCEATVGGIPYSSLNNGARINAGVDVIRTLSRHFGVAVPLFIDNAESVTKLEQLAGQAIRLCVSSLDKNLRVEVQ